MKTAALFLSLLFTILMSGPIHARTKVKVVKEVIVVNDAKELKTLTEQFRKTPTDTALREKIIKLAQRIKPAPMVSEEATLLFEKASELQKDAKDSIGYELSVAKYKEALSLAPWWGDAYFNLALTYDLLQKYEEAIATLKIYQLTINAESAELQDVQNKIFAIEAKIEKSGSLKKDIQIIPGQSIGKISVGMPSEKLRGELGDPSSSENVGPWWQNLWWKKSGFMTSIKMSLSKVDSVEISDSATQFRTVEGIGLGAPESTIQPKLGDADRSGRLKIEGRSMYCYRSGLKLTVRDGKVTSIEVFRPAGFDETYCEPRLFE